VHTGETIGRTEAEEPLLGGVALLDRPARPFADPLRLVRVPAHRGVAVDSIASRAAEQTVDRLAGDLAAQVPEGIVDGADRHHLVALPRVPVLAVQDVPDLLPGKRVETDKERLQLLECDDRRLLEERSEQAGRAVVRPDLEVRVGERHRAAARPARRAGDVGVPGEQACSPLLDDRHVGRTGHLECTDAVDLHGLSPSVDGGRDGRTP
jgi:hypothetical protein